MNDDELRAFLDSATVGGDEDQGQEHEEQAQAMPATEAPQRRSVPSFDELMNMGTGAPEPAVQPRQAPAAATPAARVQPAAPAASSAPAEPAEKPETPEWSQTYAKDDEQLVPLILPGFSPEPRERRELPPVFQTEPAAQQPAAPRTVEAQPAASAQPSHDDPAPTQPFDVLSSEAARPKPEQPNTEQPKSEPTVAAAPAAAVAATAAAVTAATAQVAQPREQTPETDPFAALVPELLDDEPDVASADSGYERISVTGGSGGGARKALPWLIVGGGVVVAILASIFVINGVRGNDTPASTESPATTAPATTEAPAETTEPEPSEEPAPEPETAPVVDPGSVYDLPITQWGVTVPRSEAFGGGTPYTLFDGDSRAMFTLPLAESLAASCPDAAVAEVWGLRKLDGGKFEVIRPARCTNPEAAAVYDKIWGLMDYMAKNPRPIAG